MNPFFKVANYGIGGQYNTHVDASDTQWKTVTSELPENEVIYGRIFGDRVKNLFYKFVRDISFLKLNSFQSRLPLLWDILKTFLLVEQQPFQW